jgi:hypothetical protein
VTATALPGSRDKLAHQSTFLAELGAALKTLVVPSQCDSESPFEIAAADRDSESDLEPARPAHSPRPAAPVFSGCAADGGSGGRADQGQRVARGAGGAPGGTGPDTLTPLN